MKFVYIALGFAILVSSGVMFFLVKKGAALRPAGVIAPAEIGQRPELISESIALRLFPEFQKAKNVIWYLDVQDEVYDLIPESTLQKYQTNQKPELFDLRKNPEASCERNCWYIQNLNVPLSPELAAKLHSEPSIEIHVQYFERGEEVTEACEKEKILEFKCVGPVSVREVKKKLKTTAPHFFMRRYLDSQFYLFIEKVK